MKSCLLFIYTNKVFSQLISQIKHLPGHKFIEQEPQTINLNNLNVEVVSSDASGIGKSHYIRQYATNKNREYVYFSLGGDISREDIMNRLCSINSINPNVVFHLDLVQTKKLDMLKDFLFSFLVLRFISQQGKLFYFNEKMEIKIEIPYGFVDFLEQYNILKLFKINKLLKSKMPPLDIPNNILSDIQIVCINLDFLKKNKINDNNIYIEGLSKIKFNELTEKEKLNYIEAKVLSTERCIELIKKYFYITTPTFYQINSFVSVLADQLRYFTVNFYLEKTILFENAMSRSKTYLYKIRQFIIESIIEITKFFTEGAYNNVIQSQDIAYKSQTADYNQEEAERIAINKLTERKVVSFSQIKSSDTTS